MLVSSDVPFKFLPYQLSMVVYWTTMAVTGNEEFGFDFGEGAWEMATTSKEGSRRVNYPILTQGGSDNKSQYEAFWFCNWIENNVQSLSINNWRASLVPAAAVIPAPIAYINVVAVKKLVVEVQSLERCLFRGRSLLNCPLLSGSSSSCWDWFFFSTGILKGQSLISDWSFTVRKLECLKQT